MDIPPDIGESTHSPPLSLSPSQQITDPTTNKPHFCHASLSTTATLSPIPFFFLAYTMHLGLLGWLIGLGLYQYPLLQESPCPQDDVVKTKPYCWKDFFLGPKS